jgi:signal transduction histidine kinase
MRERVLPFDGNIDISGSRGKGTRVVVSLPSARP